MIDTPLLVAVMGCPPERAALFAPHLAAACQHHHIDTPARLAAFLAQIGHESGGLRWVREIANGQAYEGRASLGNTQPGDGPRYRGRGLIQITGRYNYRATARSLQPHGAPDFEAEPEALELPLWAAWSAADYWASRGLNELADEGDFEAITRRINGGLNGQADRLARWRRAKAAVGAAAPTTTPEPTRPARGEANQTEGSTMPLAPVVAAVLPAIIDAIPKLGRLFGSGSAVAERNVKAAEMAVEIVRDATGALNAQDAAEKLRADPAAVQAAVQAVEQRWYELTEAGGGGIEGARKADAATQASGDIRKSPSFWIALLLLPLVYMLVASLIGLIGTASWSDDVRAGLAGSLISAIVGGLVGYYYGQTTTRNRTSAKE